MEELCEYIYRNPVKDKSDQWKDEELLQLANTCS